MLLEYKVESEYLFPLLTDNLFCDLTPKSRKSLDKIKQTKRFEKGVCFFSRGEMPCCVYLMREGIGQLLLNNAVKDIKIARLIFPNEIFGLTEAIAELPYETKAEALTTCVCECIGQSDFISFLCDEPEVCFRLARQLGSHLQKRHELFVSSIN